MDDVVQATSLEEVVDRPERETVVVNAYRDRTGRVELMEVTWKEYVVLHDKGYLKFQRDKAERPEHLPSRDTAARWAHANHPPPKKENGWGESMVERPVFKRAHVLAPVPKVDPPSPTVPKPSLVSTIQKTTPEIQPAAPVEFEKRRRTAAEKFAVLEATAAELRKQKGALLAHDLVAAAAKKLRMSYTGLSTHFYRSVPDEIKTRWLYGEAGRALTRKEIKFGILLRVREEMRKRGEPKPRKKELALAAAKPLGMKLNSTRTYIYDRLTKAEVKALDLRKQFLSFDEQVAVLKSVRQKMKEEGKPAPRHVDLAKAAAPLLKQKVSSVRTLIGSLSEELKTELEFLGSHSSAFAGRDPAEIQAGFMGAIAVLKFRRAPITAETIRLTLRLKPRVVEAYLAEHPELKVLMDET